MRYNLTCTGKKLTAKEIYNKKVGVCEHYTLLYNTLLVSQGIDAIKVSGYNLDFNEFDKNDLEQNENNVKINANTNILKNNRHCWTLALIDGNWVPLDATWNLFEKNVPLSHIFQNYGNTFFSTKSFSGNVVHNEITKEIIKSVQN